MRIFPTFAPIKAACFVVLSTTAWAAEHDSVGTFDFPTSGSPQAQEHFELGVGYLHSFGFIQDTKSSSQAALTLKVMLYRIMHGMGVLLLL